MLRHVRARVHDVYTSRKLRLPPQVLAARYGPGMKMCLQGQFGNIRLNVLVYTGDGAESRLGPSRITKSKNCTLNRLHGVIVSLSQATVQITVSSTSSSEDGSINELSQVFLYPPPPPVVM